MEINREELVKALKLVRPGLASRELIEQSTSFAFINGRVVTYNDEISVSHPVSSLEDLTGAVNAEELYSLLDRINKEIVELEIDENEITVKAGKTKAGLVLQSEILLPLEEVNEGKRKWEPLPEGFIEALKLTVHSCSRDVSSPALTCVHVRDDKVIESSDNIRITHYRLEEKVPYAPFLIPGTSVKDLLDYSITQIHYNEESGWVHFKTDDETEISCRVIEAKYPNTESVMKVDGDEISFPNKLGFVLNRAEVFAKREHSLDEEVQMTLDSKKMIVKARSETGGWFEEEIRTKYSVDTSMFSVHPAFLKKMCEDENKCVVAKDRLKFVGDNWEHLIALRTR